MRLAERALRAGYRLNSFDTLGSTNAEALARAQAGDRGRLWLTATRQTAGRGRQGRAWVSPAGNLHASLLLVDAAPQPVSPQLAFVAAVALFDAVAAAGGVGDTLALKWPNDLLADGGKLAGILVEGTRSASGSAALVAGFGVNCASRPPELAARATDLGSAAGRTVTAEAVFEHLSDAMADMLEIWDRGRGFGEVRRRWLARAIAIGTPLTVHGAGERLAGTFAGLETDGRLVLNTEMGSRSIDVGDVMVGDNRPRATIDLVGQR